jgi:hypothetical protein
MPSNAAQAGTIRTKYWLGEDTVCSRALRRVENWRYNNCNDIVAGQTLID